MILSIENFLDWFLNKIIYLFSSSTEMNFHTIHNFITQFISHSFSLFIIYLLLLVTVFTIRVFYEFLITFLSSRIDILFHKLRNRKNNTITNIRQLSEVYYLLEKFSDKNINLLVLFGNSSFRRSNLMEKSEAFGPITILNNIKSIICYLIYPHVTNVIIWSIMLAYFYSDIVNYLNLDFYLQNFINYNSTVSLTLINQFITLITIVFSLIFLIWLNTKIFKWTAIKKTKEYKYEQTIKYQESMIQNLSTVLYYSEQNIDNLSRYMKQASTSFCELITGTKKYQFKENKLVQVNLSREFHTRQNYYIDKFKSFNKENKAVNKILKNIKKEHLQSVYYDINKKLTYELFKLDIYLSAGDIDFSKSFISKEKIENYAEVHSHSLSRITKKFEEIKKVWSKQITEEEFLIPYKKINEELRIDFGFDSPEATFKNVVSDAEYELEEKVIEYYSFLRNELALSIFHYVVLQQYLIKSKNTYSSTWWRRIFLKS